MGADVASLRHTDREPGRSGDRTRRRPLNLSRSASTTSTLGRFRPLDGLRATAALLIVTCHAVLGSGNVDVIPALDANRISFLGVAVFFALSGFLLYRPFLDAQFDGRSSLSARTFLWRRLLRIVPLYWVVLTAYLLILENTGITGVADHVKMYLLLQIYDESLLSKGIPAAWTLCVDVSFYLIVPLLALAGRRLAGLWPGDRQAAFRAHALLIAAFFLIGPIWRAAWGLGGPQQIVDAWVWLPAHTDLFAVGMAIALVSSARDHGRPMAPSLRTLTAHPGFCLATTAVALAVLEITAIPLSGNPLDAGQQTLRFAVYALACTLLMVPLVLGDGRNRIASFLGSSPLGSLSDLSYGLYLWHMVVLLKVGRWLGGEKVAPFWVMFGVGVALSLVLAYCGYELIEKPSRRFRDDGGRPAGARTRRDTPAPSRL